MRDLLAFSTLPREGPSVRPRVLAYEPALREAGIRLRLSPFLSRRGFANFYATGLIPRTTKAAHATLGYVRRWGELKRARKADGVLIHREIVPRGNGPFLRKLKKQGLRIAYDLDDAIYMPPRDFVASGETSRRRMSRIKDPGEVDGMLAAADLVLAGNETLAAHARSFCDDVRVLPTPVDTGIHRPRLRPDRARPLVGWIGSPTAAYCLKDIAPALTRAAAEVPFDLLVVGAGERIEVPGVTVIHRDWSLDREALDFSSLDVGLYPLPDNPWTRGKCGMKALQYQASGVAAVVSPVGVNRDIVTDGETGSYATDPDDWTDRLLAYLRDPALRDAHAEAARASVEARWSLTALTPTFVTAIRDLTEKGVRNHFFTVRNRSMGEES